MALNKKQRQEYSGPGFEAMKKWAPKNGSSATDEKALLKTAKQTRERFYQSVREFADRVEAN